MLPPSTDGSTKKHQLRAARAPQVKFRPMPQFHCAFRTDRFIQRNMNTKVDYLTPPTSSKPSCSTSSSTKVSETATPSLQPNLRRDRDIKFSVTALHDRKKRYPCSVCAKRFERCVFTLPHLSYSLTKQTELLEQPHEFPYGCKA